MSTISSKEPVVTRFGVLDIQVCVPKEWSDKEILEFAERRQSCGTTNGWVIRKEGKKLLQGFPERNPCLGRPGFVHVMLDA